MSTTLLVGALIVAKTTALVTALIVQRRKNRIDDEGRREQQRLAHMARVSIVGELSGGLAHELKQPLTSILSNAQAAQQALAHERIDVAEVREILDDIVAEDKRAGELISRLRNLLKHEKPVERDVSTSDLLREVQGLVRPNFTANQARLVAKIDPNLPRLRGDPIQLQQVLLNLLLNACDAVSECQPQDRVVELLASADPDAATLQIVVADRGHGIEADGLERVFDAFFTTKPNGLGLGLAICRQIVTAHGGALWATHNGDGHIDGHGRIDKGRKIGSKGAAFHLTLPVPVSLNRHSARDRERTTG